MWMSSPHLRASGYIGLPNSSTGFIRLHASGGRPPFELRAFRHVRASAHSNISLLSLGMGLFTNFLGSAQDCSQAYGVFDATATLLLGAAVCEMALSSALSARTLTSGSLRV